MANYTKLTFDEIKDLVTPYDLGGVNAAEPMEGGQANSSFKLSTGKGEFLLSVCDEKDREEIDDLSQILRYLETEKFPTSRIVGTTDGKLFILKGGKPVYIKNYIEGDVIRSLNSSQLTALGKTLASLHLIKPLEKMPAQFPYGMEFFDQILKTDIASPYIEWLKGKKRFLIKSIDPVMDKGLIHGDIFWDNLLFSGNDLVAVLDFEEACHYYKLFDLGMCAVGCCGKEGRFDMKKTAFLLKGYQKHVILNHHERRQLKVFMEYAAVAASSWRFHQYNIKYPGHRMAGSYQVLSSMADHIHETGNNEFISICFN